MRVMADIQAEGLRAAGELLERVLRSERDGNGRAPSPAGDYTSLVDAWGELLQRTVSGLAPGGPVTVSVDASGVAPPIRLVLDESYESTADSGAAAEVWLHNGTSSAVGPLVFRCSALNDAEGIVLAGADVCFEPPKMEPLPARSSRAVAVSLVTTGSPRPGIYRGTIQAQGASRLWLPLEVAVEPC
jgi:hypothetical protein